MQSPGSKEQLLGSLSIDIPHTGAPKGAPLKKRRFLCGKVR